MKYMRIENDGHIVELRDYITGGQSMALRKMELGASRVTGFDQSTQEAHIESRLDIQVDVEKELLSYLVISVDGEFDGVVERLLALPSVVFDEVLAAAKEIKDGKKKEVK
jgi:hypothetical protein